MAEPQAGELGPPLAEVAWDLRPLRGDRRRWVLCSVVMAVVLVGIAWRLRSWHWPPYVVGVWLALRPIGMHFVFAADMTERLAVHETGLEVKTERAVRFVPWEQIEGFHRRFSPQPLAVAPRTRRGRLSRRLFLITEGGPIFLIGPNSGGLEEAIELIERRLLARLWQA
jgi:hypothetical protein